MEVSLFHSMADWMNVPYLQTRYGGQPPKRLGLKHPSIAPYGAFECGDGKFVLISIQNEREWVRLCAEVLNMPELASNPQFSNNTVRAENRSELDQIINEIFIHWTRDETIEKLDKASIAFGRLSDLEDLLSHPQNKFIQVITPAGGIEMLSPGAMIKGAAPNFRPVPALGQHDDPLREEFASKSEQKAK